MRTRFLLTVTVLTGLTCWAQPNARRASITGGPPDRGRCSVAVVVDGAADVEIRGDNGFLRDISGAPPQWRRFECTSPMPPNGDYRFVRTGGRGRVEMIRGNGGAAVVHIEDPESGSDTYSFDIAWGREGAPTSQGGYDRRDGDRPNPDRPGYRPDGDRRDGDRRDDDRDAYYRQRDEAFRGDWHGRFFERVRQDLEHAQAMTFPVGGDQFRLQRTKQQLNELQSSWTSGNYDRRALDEVIGDMQRVLQDNRLSGRDRDVLADDLNRLREFRDRGGWR